MVFADVPRVSWGPRRVDGPHPTCVSGDARCLSLGRECLSALQPPTAALAVVVVVALAIGVVTPSAAGELRLFFLLLLPS